ncbi:hypothetical protein EDC39_10347 [Geothermobacter ehrlichii]|uniref:Uncharacterized protein n=1 Tax=Geothermobacter ehrlichii TaxID=213224 RepID=A0A5D3WLQ7_9BACT|nr:hypothetical protein [Geothermobacter ehrlichii]TYO99204.1 hypothetical protein EDC39_10347 [Geothermobacter ehrlichii]
MIPTAFDFPLGIQPWPRELRHYGRKLAEGYTFSPLEDCSDSYRLTAMIGAGRVAALFRTFARTLLPDESFLILEYYLDDWSGDENEQSEPAVFYSPYLPTETLLRELHRYLPRLIHDGFVGFGLANNRLGIEIFFSEEKIFTCFTGNHLQATSLFAREGIPHNSDLVFPADFGHDHLSLQCYRRNALPPELAVLPRHELDFQVFCRELVDRLEMYQVEDGLSFYLSRREQDLIEQRLRQHEEFADYADEDFGAILLDWSDFVDECDRLFEGDLWEYQQGLKLRDLIQYVIEGVPAGLRQKLETILDEPDRRFRKALVDRRKRLDAPGNITLRSERFWYQGIIRNQGTSLRRDLIRAGWYQPA